MFVVESWVDKIQELRVFTQNPCSQPEKDQAQRPARVVLVMSVSKWGDPQNAWFSFGAFFKPIPKPFTASEPKQAMKP